MSQAEEMCSLIRELVYSTHEESTHVVNELMKAGHPDWAGVIALAFDNFQRPGMGLK